MIGTTAENLAAAAAGEKMEWSELYPAFADEADAEGFADIADSYRHIAEVEAHHEARYNKLLANVQKDEVFKRLLPHKWICLNCGYVYEGCAAPDICPACKHPQAYFELLAENY